MDYILGISGEELRETFRQGKELVLVDVGVEEEPVSEFIPGAIRLPLNHIAGQAEKMLPNRQAAIIVYTSAHGEAVSAAVDLFEMGYTNVRYFKGDINLLMRENRPSETVAA